ncbi:hypothetical protein HKCCE3408_13225 [Rhodobacterales bacterium HKCCE3408]|nr:hypothetical protein [Rhodobacterales bacterium HKCCE3408]
MIAAVSPEGAAALAEMRGIEREAVAQEAEMRTEIARMQLVTNAADLLAGAVDRHACLDLPGGWFAQLNDLIVADGIVAPRPTSIDAYHDCTAEANRWRVLPHMRAIDLPGTSSTLTRRLIFGDPCGDELHLMIVDFRGNLSQASHVMPPRGATFAVTGTIGQDYFDQPLYQAYVPAGSFGYPSRPNGIDQSLIAVREITQAQCGRLPTSVEVSIVWTEGTTPDEAPRHRDGSFPRGEPALTLARYYSGSFDPADLEARLVHDDPEMAGTFLHMAEVRAEALRTLPERERQQRERMALGAALVFGALYFVYEASPCNDAVPLSELPYWCDRAIP